MSARQGARGDARGRELWRLIAGFVLWFAALCVVYGLHAWGCQRGWPRPLLIGALATSVATTLGVLWLLHRRWRRGGSARGWLPRALAGSLLAAAAATLFSLGVPLLLTPCIA